MIANRLQESVCIPWSDTVSLDAMSPRGFIHLLRPNLESVRLTFLLKRWLHPENYFDYIHSRHTVMAIKDWPKLLRTGLECVNPHFPPFLCFSHALFNYPRSREPQCGVPYINNTNTPLKL